MQNQTISRPNNILWTGGWDSTYRILQCLIVNKFKVQPHYIIDANRKSLRHELLAMGKIKNMLFKEFAYTKELLLPTIFFPKSEIKISEKLNAIYEKLNRELPMGTQYGWMSQYCHSEGIMDMELSIEDHTGGHRYDTMKKHLKKVKFKGEDVYVMDERYKGTSFYEVFKCYIWPILDTNRDTMLKIASKYNFTHLLNKTWYCHSPLKDSTPCGICTPCVQVYEEGDKKRLTTKARRRYFFRNLLSSDNFKKAYPKTYKVLKKIKPK